MALDSTKQAARTKKTTCLKLQAFLIAMIADYIDLLSVPSNDPRLNGRLKEQHVTQIVMQLLDTLLQAHMTSPI